MQKIDAAVRTKNGNTYVFSGAYFWKIQRSGHASNALRIREKWEGLEDNIDAALTRGKNGKTYFFKESRCVKLNQLLICTCGIYKLCVVL